MPAPWGECPRCGFKRRLNTFRKEWTGQRVCPPCWDPKPPQNRAPKVKPEGVPVRHAQPETEPVFGKNMDGSGL